ncbi:MAG TPA: FAD-dependent oxidoreductase, partial [Aquihabitans sp.]|nr:FAD-dependent oxidoreductase [Aquihabitans sp.]
MRRPVDLVVIGMGSAGLTAVQVAVALGLRVVAVEADRFGGDCLWTGCVPSKALLARTAGPGPAPAREVWAAVSAAQDAIARSDDDPEHIRAMGVDVRTGRAVITGPNEVSIDGEPLATRFVLVCTGSRPAMPDIEGLADAGTWTNERLFTEQPDPPGRLLVLGGGPVGVELAQAFRRWGSEVVVVQRGGTLLPRDEPSLVAELTGVLEAEGIEVATGVDVSAVTRTAGGVEVRAVQHGAAMTWSVDRVLVATGRAPVVEGLGLEEAGVEVGPDGIAVDERLRTSVPWILAAGDVTDRPRFTHVAGHDAAVAVRNLALPGSSRAPAVIPWCTFTSPELAHVGMTEAEARERHR